MKLLKRKVAPVAPPTPRELLEQVRIAQEDHADTIARATSRLVETHTELFNTADNRHTAINEQILLLAAEAEALEDVMDGATGLPA